jgi:tryptophanyl-tRNA synthetase
MSQRMDTGVVNPWASDQSFDIDRLFTEFGIEKIETVTDRLPEVPDFMRRKIVFGHRDYGKIADAIRNRDPFYILTGFMPSGHQHLGHLLVMKEVVWHIKQGGLGYICIADREAHAVRNISWDKCREFGDEYLSCLYALGFEGETYLQSENRVVQDLCFEASAKVNFSELSAIYGFTPDTDIGHAVSVLTQVSDILYPQMINSPAPTVVPVGLDQDPHIRLTRGVAHKLRMFTVEDRGTHVSVRSKEAPVAAMDAIEAAFSDATRFEGHIDIKGIPYDTVSSRIRAIEREFGGYGFVTPSATLHRFLPGLNGGKMSSSVPESIIGFTEDEKTVRKKIMAALTGGRMTLAEQKELGGLPDTCPVYLLNLYHMVDDDDELMKIRKRCLEGDLLCGNCKKETAERVLCFLRDFREKIDVAAEELKKKKRC